LFKNYLFSYLLIWPSKGFISRGSVDYLRMCKQYRSKNRYDLELRSQSQTCNPDTGNSL